MTEKSKIDIFDIQRFCLHDGPGIRTVVFLKGCSLRCHWCQNPESFSPHPQIAFYLDRCAGCMECQKACPNGAIQSGVRRIKREACKVCGTCAAACPFEALRLAGKKVSTEELLETIESDKSYYDATGGGVTLSGGEPLLQADSISELFDVCRKKNIHTTIETCGEVSFDQFKNILPVNDLFLFDLKAGEASLYKKLTGSNGKRIFENARKLVETGAKVIFRMPVIPGMNDSEKSIEGIATFIKGLGHLSIHLLRYHAGGESKIGPIDSSQPLLNISAEQADQAIQKAIDRFRKLGIEPVYDNPDSANKASKLFTDRVHRLRETVQASAPTICPERALLVTEYFKDRKNHSKPLVVQKAEALEHILINRTATIYPDELLVGCFSSKRVGGSILPELHGTAILLDLLSFSSREVNPLQINTRDRLALASKVLPFWSTKSLAARAFPPVRAATFIADQLGGKKYLINETGGISHIVPDYTKLLALGTHGISKIAEAGEQETEEADKKNFYQAVQIACKGLEKMAERYADVARKQAEEVSDLKRRDELLQTAEVCKHVPGNCARTLQEAFQSILFAQIAINNESLDNSVCPGRLDQVLYPYYQADRKAGRLDENGARELIGCFTVKMCEIVPIFSKQITRFHGGMFNGQVVVVGGVDTEGNDATNDLTWLFLDAMDELRMRQPNYHARIHKQSPAAYVKRIASMLKDGSAAPSLMNDEIVVPMMVGRKMAIEDARDYSPVGCVEPVSCGRTFGSTDAALTNFALCLERALGTKPGRAKTKPAESWTSIEDAYAAFERQVEFFVDELIDDLQGIERANARLHPTPLTSMLLSGCLESGIDSTAGGTKYNASGVQPVGVADVADSLTAVDHVVFQNCICDIPTLIQALRKNFAGYEKLQGYLFKAPKYGNDEPGADRAVDRVMGIFANSLKHHANTRGGAYNVGFYSVTAHLPFGEATGALPSGRPSGKPLANGLSCTNGLDRLGPTASLNSTAGLGLVDKARNGINLNLKIDATSLGNGKGEQAVEGLIRGYFAKGGMQVQLNVTDPKILIEASNHPERYPWLLVRVSGYSAYFADLSPQMKQELIDRSLHCGIQK